MTQDRGGVDAVVGVGSVDDLWVLRVTAGLLD